MRYASVRPVSTMSSTTTTSRPLMSELEVMQDLDPPGVGREARDRDEVDLDRYPLDGPGEVGDEEQRAFQDADEHDTVGMIRDLRAQPAHLRGNGVGIEQDGRGHVSR